ncbi:MAG TPA: serine/threonine-protein kinase [Polyangiaceae bacterium]|jgi:serine/threonine-protein kinase
MSPQAPKSVGRYAVHAELASGGMASVYYARLLGPSGFARTVVVKRPHPQYAREKDFAMMFIDEARVASRIRHANVVSTLDVIETQDELALVMDYVHGEALSRLSAASKRKGERVPLRIAAAILIDALHGLHAAHEATDEEGKPLGIVHRDVSPQNILVGADGITRIVDFGIAKATGRLLTTRDGSIKGKYAYMAPEQIRGEKVSRQTDIFAASIVFWELLTGTGLFRGATEGEEIYKAMEGVTPAPSSIVPEVPAAFDAIVLRGLERDPAKRYPTAREMAADLEKAAPAVRPSEIGAWVQRLAGEVLSARAAVIAQMEKTARSDEIVEGPRLVGAAVSSPSGASATSGANVASQISNVAMVSERAASPPSLGGGAGRAARGRVAWFGVGVVLIGALFGVRSFLWRSVAANPPPPLAPMSASAPLASTPAPPEPSATAVETPHAAASSPAPAASTSAKPRPGGKRQNPPGSCNPPYTIDSQGREIFKLQCL